MDNIIKNNTVHLIRHIRSTFLDTDMYKTDLSLAELVGITPSQFSRLSTGVCEPSLRVFLRLLSIRKRQGYDILPFIPLQNL